MFTRGIRTALLTAISVFAVLNLYNFWHLDQASPASKKILLNNSSFLIQDSAGLSSKDAYVWKAKAIDTKQIPKTFIFRIHTKNLDYAPNDIVNISGVANKSPIPNLYNIYYPQISITGQQKNDYFYNLRHQQINRIKQIFTTPSANFINGLIFGGYNDNSKYFQNNLRILGLNHILAVSGFNLTLLVLLLRKIFPIQAKKPRFLIIIFTIWFFALLVGGGSSILRASLFLSILLLLEYIGLKPKAMMILFLLILLFAIIQPATIINDIGWQLSYAAFGGILVFDKISARFVMEKLNKAIVLSLGAYIFTVPIILFHFKQASLLSVITTVLIEPIILPLMLLGIIVLALGYIIDLSVLERSFVWTDQAINWILAKINISATHLKGMELKIEYFDLVKIAIFLSVFFGILILIKKSAGFQAMTKIFLSMLIFTYLYFIYLPMPSEHPFLVDDNFQIMINPNFEAGYLDSVGYHFSKVKPTVIIFNSKNYANQSSLKVLAKDYNIRAVLAPGFHYAIDYLGLEDKLFNIENLTVWDFKYNLPLKKSEYHLNLEEKYQIYFAGNCYQIEDDILVNCLIN